MKWKFPRTFQSYSPSTRSANPLFKRPLKRHLGEKWKQLCTLCKPEASYGKTGDWTDFSQRSTSPVPRALFSRSLQSQGKAPWGRGCSKMSTFVTEKSFQFNEWYLESIVTAKIVLYTKQNKKESKKVHFRTAIKFTYSLALTWKVEHACGSFLGY